MTRQYIEELFADCEDLELLFMDGYDDCIAGVVERFGQDPIVCYDKFKVIAKLMDGGMSHEEALEWFYFNQIGAWVGDGTPCFIVTTEPPDINPNLEKLKKALKKV